MSKHDVRNWVFDPATGGRKPRQQPPVQKKRKKRPNGRSKPGGPTPLDELRARAAEAGFPDAHCANCEHFRGPVEKRPVPMGWCELADQQQVDIGICLDYSPLT